MSFVSIGSLARGPDVLRDTAYAVDAAAEDSANGLLLYTRCGELSNQQVREQASDIIRVPLEFEGTSPEWVSVRPRTLPLQAYRTTSSTMDSFEAV